MPASVARASTARADANTGVRLHRCQKLIQDLVMALLDQLPYVAPMHMLAASCTAAPPSFRGPWGPWRPWGAWVACATTAAGADGRCVAPRGVVMQFLAMWYYILSYIPFGRAGATKLAKAVVGNAMK